jgi:hypothetical protein
MTLGLAASRDPVARARYEPGAVALTDQLVEVIGLLRGVLAHGKVVDDQQWSQQTIPLPRSLNSSLVLMNSTR